MTRLSSLQGGSDAFVMKLDPTGSSIVYSTYLGGSNDDRAHSVAVDGAGSAYVTGRTASIDFPLRNPLLDSFRGGLEDAWMAKLNPSGDGLLYSTYLGGSDNDAAFGIAVDSGRTAYVTGGTRSTDLPTTRGAFSENPNGALDAFVIKLNPSAVGASSLVYGTYLGGSGSDRGHAISVDGAGNAMVAGQTASANFPTRSALQPTHGGGGNDGFFSKLNAAGSDLLYSTYLGGSAADQINALALDSHQQVHLTGETFSPNFVVLGGSQTARRGLSDGFVTRLDPGQVGQASLIYSTYVGGDGEDRGTAIAVDAMDRTYVTGAASTGASFPVTADAFQSQFAGGSSDSFVAKLDSSSTGLASWLFCSFLGGAARDVGSGVAVDASGSAWVAGQTSSSNFPVVRALQPALAGGVDAYLTRLGSDVAPPPPDLGTSPDLADRSGPDMAVSGHQPSSSGGCSVGVAAPFGSAPLLVLVLALGLGRRRRTL